MPIIQKNLSLSRADYYQVHLSLVNAVIPKQARLTEKELEVLALFMSFQEDIPLGRFGTYARNIVKETLKLNDSGLSNYLRFLKNKRFLIERDKEIIFVPLIIVPDDTQEYKFKLTNREVE